MFGRSLLANIYKSKLRNLDKNTFNKLSEMSMVAKDIYNQANYLVKQYLKYTGSYLNDRQMYSVMSEVENLEGEINFKKIKARIGLNILQRLDSNYKSFFKIIKDWKKHPEKYKGMPRPPHYIKDKYYDLIYRKGAFSIKNNKVSLGKGLDDFNFSVPSNLHNKHIKTITLKRNYGYYDVIYVYEDETEYLQIPETDRCMGIDLGLNNLATCVTNFGSEPFIINGRPLKSINQFFNKKYSKIKAVNKRVNNMDWSKNQAILLRKRNNSIKNYLHHSSKMILQYCIKHNISSVYVGDVASSLSKINLGKRNNQNFINISLGQFVEKISYKLEKHNITVKVTDESYTSKSSFIDNDILPKKNRKSQTKEDYVFSGSRIKRGLYRYSSGIINADVNGAYNIIRKEIPKFNFKQLYEGIEVITRSAMNRVLLPSKFTAVDLAKFSKKLEIG